MSNWLKTGIYLAICSLIILLLGILIAGHLGFIVALVLVVLGNVNALRYAGRILLLLFRAKKADKEKYAQYYQVLAVLSKKAGIPEPSLFLVKSDAINIFAVRNGYKKSAIALTSGLLEADESVWRAAMAYAISQIHLGYVLPGTVAANVARGFFSFWSLDTWKTVFGYKVDFNEQSPVRFGKVVCAPIVALLIGAIVSPSRVYKIDQAAVLLTGDVAGYKRTLKEMDEMHQKLPFPAGDLHLSASHLFMTSPVRNQRYARLFNKFPSAEERIKQL